MTGGPSDPASSIWRPDERDAAPAPPPAPRRDPPQDRPGVRRRRRRRTRPLVWLVVAAFVLLLDGAYVGVKLVSGLQGASSSLEDARARFEEGDVDAAQAEVQEALEASRSVLALRPHPAYALGSLFADVQAVTDVALAAEDVSHAGLAAVEAARTLGVRSGREIASTVYEGGRIRFDALEEAEPLVAEASGRLDDAADHLADAPEPSLGIVADSLKDAIDEVETARSTARKGRVLFAALPSLLGRNEPRSYLLAFQALGEARATGGVIGFYGVLRAEDGAISLGHVAPIHDLNRTDKSPPVDAPAWFERSYAPQFALRQALQVNVSPRVPVVADVLLEMYEASRGDALDGVVFMDPVTMQALLRSTGPITVGGFEGEIGPENAADVLMRESYVEFEEPAQQNLYLAAVIREFWKRIEDGDLNGAELVDAVTEQVAQKHFMVYARDPEDRNALAEVGADGDYTKADPHVQQVFNNNYSVNKVDYFLRRTVDTRIELTADGEARVRTTVTLRNEAPAGPPSLLLGPPPNKPENPPGLNRMVLGFLLPKAAQPHQYFATKDADPEEPFVYDDSGHPVVWEVVDVLPGDSRTIAVTYVIPDAIATGPDGGDMTFVLWPHARPFPDDFRVEVSPPEGYVVRLADEDSAALRNLITVEGTLDTEQPVRFHMEPR